MKEQRTNSLLKIVSIVLVFAITTPAIVKFSHGFQNHEHEVCFGQSTSHLHQLDIDCDFYKFKLNSQYLHIQKPFNALEFSYFESEIVSQYFFVSDFQRLPFSLRGPPVSL